MHGELAELHDRHDSTNQSLSVAERDVLELSVRCEELTLESEALRSRCDEEISRAQHAQQAKHDAAQRAEEAQDSERRMRERMHAAREGLHRSCQANISSHGHQQHALHASMNVSETNSASGRATPNSNTSDSENIPEGSSRSSSRAACSDADIIAWEETVRESTAQIQRLQADLEKERESSKGAASQAAWLQGRLHESEMQIEQFTEELEKERQLGGSAADSTLRLQGALRDSAGKISELEAELERERELEQSTAAEAARLEVELRTARERLRAVEGDAHALEGGVHAAQDRVAALEQQLETKSIEWEHAHRTLVDAQVCSLHCACFLLCFFAHEICCVKRMVCMHAGSH